MHGEYKKYSKDGILKVHCFYKDGLLHGEEKRYDECGNLEIHRFYKDGQIHGEEKKYDDGDITGIFKYEYGKYCETIFNKYMGIGEK